jgi:hypothetical protein
MIATRGNFSGRRSQLVGIEPDAGAEGRLQRIASAAVAERQRKAFTYAASTTGLSGAPRPTCDHASSSSTGADFSVPEDLDLLALRIIGDAGQLGTEIRSG